MKLNKRLVYNLYSVTILNVHQTSNAFNFRAGCNFVVFAYHQRFAKFTIEKIGSQKKRTCITCSGLDPSTHQLSTGEKIFPLESKKMKMNQNPCVIWKVNPGQFWKASFTYVSSQSPSSERIFTLTESEHSGVTRRENCEQNTGYWGFSIVRPLSFPPHYLAKCMEQAIHELHFGLYLPLQNSSGRCEEASEVGSSVADEINTAQAGTPHALVLSTFETIWNAVCQFR